MTPGTRPPRRTARAAPFPARSRGWAAIFVVSTIIVSVSLRRPPGVPRAFLGGSVEQRGDRALLADPFHRLRHQRRDGKLADVLRDAHGLRGLDRVGDHDFLDW